MCRFNSRSPSGLRLIVLSDGRKILPVSIHAAQAGCDLKDFCHGWTIVVSIHAAQAGCDLWHHLLPMCNKRFNSRSPSGLRQSLGALRQFLLGFNSRSPSGLRRADGHRHLHPHQFQFTQPKRAATGRRSPSPPPSSVSIHAAQAGCDYLVGCILSCPIRFNSRSPSGLRLCHWSPGKTSSQFQFTQPKRAATYHTQRAQH